MEKRISYSQFQQVKSAAKMMDPNMRKIESLKNKIMPLVNEMKQLQALNDSLEEGIVKVVGLPVYDLVKKVIEPTGAVGKDGKPIKVTKYLPTDIVSYDEQKKQYVIVIADENPTQTSGDGTAPSTESEDKGEPNFQGLGTPVAEEPVAESPEASKVIAEPSNEPATEAGDGMPWNN